MAGYKSETFFLGKIMWEILKIQKEIKSEWSFHYQEFYSKICLKMDNYTTSI